MTFITTPCDNKNIKNDYLILYKSGINKIRPEASESNNERECFFYIIKMPWQTYVKFWRFARA